MFSSRDFASGKLPVSLEDIRRLLGTKEGQQLLKLLNQDGGAALRQAADSIKAGDYEAVKQKLGPLLATEEAAQLLQKLDPK